MTDLTHGAIHEQVRLARELNDTLPDGTQRVARGVRLGQAQIEAIVQHHRQASGMDDVGPVTEFAGLRVLSSRAADKLTIEYEGDPEDSDAPTSVNVPPPPEPSEEQG